MLRDRSLIPLSHQHQRALALCVRMDRAFGQGEIDLEAWQAEIQAQFEEEIEIHFAAEERAIFPAAAECPELRPLVKELQAEHASLWEFFDRAVARTLDAQSLENYVERLAIHIRKEERELFEGMQRLMTPEQLARLGPALEKAMQEAVDARSVKKRPPQHEA
jgi:hemerythrin-like domain-containing protein